MVDRENVAVLGFGRSGTTWVSDIISKVAGTAVLFEPWHPEVLPDSEALSYRTTYDGTESEAVLAHLRAALSKQQRVPWLLRNHLPAAVHEVDPRFVEQVWDEVGVLGFKTIRGMMMPDWIVENIAPRAIFIVRHPLAVVASIKRRSNFWEFGWPRTFELFLRNALGGKDPIVAEIRAAVEKRGTGRNDIERVSLMWAVTHAIAVPKMQRVGVPILFYEDLYDDPFRWTRKLLGHLDLESHGILPTYLFTPALTTHRTLHGQGGLRDPGGGRIDPEFFWSDTLSPSEQETVLEVVDAFGVHLYGPDGSRVRDGSA